MMIRCLLSNAAAMAVLSLGAATSISAQDILVRGGAIIRENLCVGDCSTPMNFFSETIILRNTQTQILFDDISNTFSFPTNDWRLIANDSFNGGVNKFTLQDATAGTNVFTVLAGARNNALFVGSNSKLGMGTPAPVLDLHIKTGDTPAIRLEQDTSSQFPAQTWDIAGNNANFLIRDQNTGNLPFRILTGTRANSLVIATSGRTGFGTDTPAAALDVVQVTGNAAPMLRMQNNGGSFFEMVNTTSGRSWFFTHENAIQGRFIIGRDDNGPNSMFVSADGTFQVGGNGSAGNGMFLDANGNLTIGGNLTQNSDKNSKMAIVQVDRDAILDKVTALPISAWTYKTEAETGVRHIGPMAQDFHALFGTGADETGISTIDTSGVALAAIQALTAQNETQSALIETLSARIETLDLQVKALLAVK